MKSFAELNRELFRPADPVIDRFEILWATPKELNLLKDFYQPSHVALSWLSAIDPDGYISFRLKAKLLAIAEQSKASKDLSYGFRAYQTNKIKPVGHSQEVADYSPTPNRVSQQLTYIDPILDADIVAESPTIKLLLGVYGYKNIPISLMTSLARSIKNRFTSYELSQFKDTSQPNYDIPDEIYSFEQGQSQRLNDHLDPDNYYTNLRGNPVRRACNTVNNAHFRELCVERKDGLHRLSFKDSPKLPSHLDPNWLMSKLFIDRPLAIRLAKALGSMEHSGIDASWDIAKKLFFGTKASKARLAESKKRQRPPWIRPTKAANSPAVKATVGIIGCKNKETVISQLETIAAELDSVTVKQADFIPQVQAYDEEVIYGLNTGKSVFYDEETENDELEQVGQASNPFTTKPLFDGRESLPYEITAEIATADLKKLDEIQARFYPTKSAHNGQMYPARYQYMSKRQWNMARWTLIPKRREQLVQQAAKNITQDGLKVISWVKDLGRTPQASGLIYAYQAGETYNLYGKTLSFESMPSKAEATYIWSIYNAA